MADQEFLASYGVEIDESGVSRLQSILDDNKKSADDVAASFSAATAAIREYEKAASGNQGASGEAGRSSGSPSGVSRVSKLSSVTEEPDRTGWHYVEESNRWMPDADTAMKNLAQLQLSGILTGDDAPAVPRNARELTLQNLETMFLGQASLDSNNAARNLINWKDIGLPSNPTAQEGYSDMIRAAQDLIREPMEQAREYMKQAIAAEEAGENGSEYIKLVDEVLRKPLEQVKDLVNSFNFDDPGSSNEGERAGAEGVTGSFNLATARQELAAFREEAADPVALSGSATALVSSARTAFSSIKSIFSSPITIKAQIKTGGDDGGDGVNPITDGPTYKMSTGGRFDSPANVQVAEDGDAEYIIPIKKESRAIPLLRQLLGELSPAARASLDVGNAGGIAGGVSAGSDGATHITQYNQNVSAPVSIEVKSSGGDAARIGQSVYNIQNNYLLRTLKGVFGK